MFFKFQPDDVLMMLHFICPTMDTATLALIPIKTMCY